jgi:hypothetical protein
MLLKNLSAANATLLLWERSCPQTTTDPMISCEMQETCRPRP